MGGGGGWRVESESGLAVMNSPIGPCCLVLDSDDPTGVQSELPVGFYWDPYNSVCML